TTLATADVFTVQAGQTTTLDEFTMYAESVITGTTVRGDSTPLPGVRVTAYDATTGRAVKSVTSDGLGQFRIGALRWGDYKVRALLPGWITTFATGKASLATADVFTLVTGQTLDLTAPLVLQAEAVLTGQIMGFSVGWDDPLPGVTVVAIDIATGKGIGVDVTRAADDPQGYGTFRIGGLPAGQYVVRATKAGWSTSWAFDQANRATADVYTLTAGQHLALPAPWPMFGEVAIEGQVLGNFDPLGYATVTVFDADTGRALRSVVSDGDGDYRVGGLRAGFDPIHIKVRASKTGWYTSWAEGRATESTATVYELRAGETLVQQWDPMVLYLDLAPRDL
ncbi:MAG: carboxypeptidase regulatory-like domain-containing protein, partial [Cellulomonadaceae bacterium]|nr:carboxypeptidase regulatory-like domain-containing protein [Cellulomonadaceae bacterium]